MSEPVGAVSGASRPGRVFYCNNTGLWHKIGADGQTVALLGRDRPVDEGDIVDFLTDWDDSRLHFTDRAPDAGGTWYVNETAPSSSPSPRFVPQSYTSTTRYTTVPAFGSPDWGAPSSISEGPGNAYQVAGGFEPPTGSERAEAGPGIGTYPGVVQDAGAAPNDAYSHSRGAGNIQRHSIAQIDQMYGAIIQKYLDKYNGLNGTNVPKQVIEGIIYQESQGDPNVFGDGDSGGSRGLMQVTAENAELKIPGKNQYNPEVSIETGIKAITMAVGQVNGNITQGLAMYNQGTPNTAQGKAYAQWIELWGTQAPA